jgi:hypothetical protein
MARASSTFHQSATSDSIRSRQERSSFRLQQGQQGPQRLGAVANEVDLHRIADAEHAAVDIDLDRSRLPGPRQELGIRKAAAHHEQRVAAGHQVPARTGSEQTDGARDIWQVVWKRGLAQQRLGDACTKLLGYRDDLVGGLERASADEHRHLRPCVQHLGRPPEILVAGHHTRQ